MNDFDVYDRLPYKLRLLYCLMLNYYRNYYSNRKMAGKVLVLSTSRKMVIYNFQKMYYTISHFQKKDILTLKKFTTFYDKQLKQLFTEIDNKNIGYNKVIKDIKREYTPYKSLYINLPKKSLVKIPQENNIIFMEFYNSDNIYDKHLIKEVFIPERFELDYDKYPIRTLIKSVEVYIRETKKAKEVLESASSTGLEFINLSIFLNSNSELEICDEIIGDLKDDYFDE